MTILTEQLFRMTFSCRERPVPKARSTWRAYVPTNSAMVVICVSVKMVAASVSTLQRSRYSPGVHAPRGLRRLSAH